MAQTDVYHIEEYLALARCYKTDPEVAATGLEGLLRMVIDYGETLVSEYGLPRGFVELVIAARQMLKQFELQCVQDSGEEVVSGLYNLDEKKA